MLNSTCLCLVKAQLKAMRTSDAGRTLTSEVITKTKDLHHRVHAEWAARKKICMELISQIAEALGQTTDAVMSSVGVEVDEDFIPDDAYQAYG